MASGVLPGNAKTPFFPVNPILIRKFALIQSCPPTTVSSSSWSQAWFLR
uniref:Uncharacterized protein n=1 Tax=Anguilla anguilla TaxID=7936 RepID=A0A0E9S048_ANGAN